MTTIHAYTNDQKILDQIHSDLRRARAAAMSMIPTTTGAARAVGEVLPELKGKLDGSAIRVPTPNVSLVDLTFTPEPRHHARRGQRDRSRRRRESGPLKGILDYTDEPLVSIDLNHTPASSTVDSLETAVLEGKLVRVVSWYDNEWGFSNRMVDTAGGDGEARADAGMAGVQDPRRPAGRPDRQARAGPRRPQRADGGRRGHRRHAAAGDAADGARASRPRRDRAAAVAFRPAQGRDPARHVDRAAGAAAAPS